MSKIEPELISGMGYVGTSPGVLYRMTPAGKHLTAGGGSTVVINGAKDNAPLDRLTLHGGSTQGSTTGAQLLDINNLTDVSNYPNTAIAENGGLSKRNEDLSSPDRYLINVIPNMQYSFSAVDFVNGAVLQISDLYQKGESESVVDTRIYAQRKQVEFNSGKYEQLTLSFFSSQLNTEFKATHIMLNAGSAALLWEPYTGGAPSPSPSYPQEIESAGQSGEIGVEVLGKNLIPFPYPILGGAGTQIERGGVKYTVQSDGGIRCVGTPTAVEYINLSRIKFSDVGLTATHPTNGKIVLSGEKMAYDSSNHALFIYITSDQLGKPIDTVIYPQIELGTVATSYEPYKPVQTLIIPTPDGLPGIPVTSGGNYTDADGQQWVCDEIDLARGERVQQTIKVVLDGSQKIIIQKHQGFNRFAIGENDFPIPSGYAGFCSHFIVNPSPVTMNTIDGTICVYSNGNVYLRSDRFKSADELKSFLKENPVALEYCLAEPIRTPLPPETIAAYKKLHTYSPTTTVINDAGAGMSVGYKGK